MYLHWSALDVPISGCESRGFYHFDRKKALTVRNHALRHGEVAAFDRYHSRHPMTGAACEVGLVMARMAKEGRPVDLDTHPLAFRGCDRPPRELSRRLEAEHGRKPDPRRWHRERRAASGADAASPMLEIDGRVFTRSDDDPVSTHALAWRRPGESAWTVGAYRGLAEEVEPFARSHREYGYAVAIVALGRRYATAADGRLARLDPVTTAAG